MIKGFFHFSIAEHRGLTFLVIVLLLMVIIRFVPLPIREAPVELSYVNLSLPIEHSDEKPNQQPLYPRKKRISYFDPNYITAKELYSMGYDNKFVKSWYGAKSEIGFIQTKAQFKMLNIEPKAKEEMLPFILFKSKKSKKNYKNGKVISVKPNLIMVDINQADSVLFKSLKGIGNKLSKRVVKYRDKLGGFNSINQLTEVYGVTDEVVTKNRNRLSCQGDLSKIKLNNITLSQLVKHPYIDYKFGKRLIAFRNQHGNYSDSSDLYKLYGVDTSALQRIIPYLTFD